MYIDHIGSTKSAHNGRTAHDYCKSGVSWIASIRRIRERIAATGIQGEKSLIAGLIALGVCEVHDLVDAVSDILGRDAELGVEACVNKELEKPDARGLWRSLSDGSLALVE